MSKIIIIIIVFFSLIAAIDRMFGNKMGLGNHFEEGFKSMGSLSLTMLGIYTLSPLIGKMLIPILKPITRITGIDPSIFMGIFLAPDMGGFNAATEIAVNDNIGLFSGLILSSMLGATLVFTIPIALGIINKENQVQFSKGILFGIITVPIGSLAAGLIMKIQPYDLFINHIPIILFSIFLSLGLYRFPEKIFAGFSIFSKLIVSIGMMGLVLGILDFTLGITIIDGIISFDEGLIIVGKIAIILSGAYPLVYFVSNKLNKILSKVSKCMGVNNTSVLGLITSLVNCIPMLALYDDMDDRGKVLNSAFAVGSAFVFGGQMGFVLGVAEEYIYPFILGKFIAGFTSIILVFVMTKDYKQEDKVLVIKESNMDMELQ